jgi:antitoxin Phd
MGRRWFGMTNRWPLQEAKNRLGTVVDEALEHGPQIITRRGRKAVVVLSIDEYKRIADPDQNLVDFFRSSPFYSLDIGLTRDKEFSQETEF